MKFCFGDIVVVEENLIGVVVKCWANLERNNWNNWYEVYVREYNSIENYDEKDIQRYLVRHKYLDEEEVEYQRNAILGR